MITKSIPSSVAIFSIFGRGMVLCLLSLTLVLLSGCITTPAPIDEFAYARAAIEAARSIESARHAPGYWSQAEEAYRQAKILFEERDYQEARLQFIRARQAAEKAENAARWLRQKNGEVL